MEPSRNRLASTEYFAKVCIVLHAWVCTMQYACLHQNKKKNHRWSNLFERCGIARKMKFPIFSISVFRVIFIVKFSMKYSRWLEKWKSENLIFHSFQHIAHHPWKTGSKLRVGGGLHILSDKAQLFFSKMVEKLRFLNNYIS